MGLKDAVGKEAAEHLNAKSWAFWTLISPIWARNLLASSSSVSPAEPLEDSFRNEAKVSFLSRHRPRLSVLRGFPGSWERSRPVKGIPSRLKHGDEHGILG